MFLLDSILLIVYAMNSSKSIPVRITKGLNLVSAFRKTLESEAEPSQPGNTYTNFMFRSHTPKTLVMISCFLFQYLP